MQVAPYGKAPSLLLKFGQWRTYKSIRLVWRILQAKNILMEEDNVNGDKIARMLIWCLHSRSAGATWVMLRVLFKRGPSQDDCEDLEEVLIMTWLDFGRRYSWAYCHPVNCSFSFFRLILPPVIHCNNVLLNGLFGGVVQFEVSEPWLVFGFVERLRDAVFQPLVSTTWSYQ